MRCERYYSFEKAKFQNKMGISFVQNYILNGSRFYLCSKIVGSFHFSGSSMEGKHSLID